MDIPFKSKAQRLILHGIAAVTMLALVAILASFFMHHVTICWP